MHQWKNRKACQTDSFIQAIPEKHLPDKERDDA
jgi:hypothetical protein